MEENEKETELGLALFIKTIVNLIAICSAVVAVYALIWSSWNAFRVCLTILVTYGLGFLAHEIISARRGK